MSIKIIGVSEDEFTKAVREAQPEQEPEPQPPQMDNAFLQRLMRLMPKPIRVRQSKYLPHQSTREMQRRVRQMAKLQEKENA